MRTTLLFLALLVSKISFSQDMLGVSNGNYAGNSGMAMNPTAMLLMPYKWELQIVSFNLSVDNNFVGMPKRKILGGTEAMNTEPYGGLNFYTNSRDKAANMHFALGLPAIIFRFKDMAIGAHMTIRNDLSVHNVSSDLAILAYKGMDYKSIQGRDIEVDGMRIGDLTFIETAISFGKQLSKSESRKWLAAGSLKYITAFQGSYAGIDDANLRIENDSTLYITKIKGSIDYSYIEDPADLLRFRCTGFGVDLGTQYVSNPFTQKYANGRPIPMKKYDYRVGVSLMDLGFVRFGRNAHAMDFNTDELNFDNLQTTQVNGTAGIDSLIYATAMNGTAIKNSFVMSLPTGLSVQFDRCLKPRWYLNMTAIQRVPMPMARVDRPNMLAATIRYETPFFEVGFPYSFYDYYRHRLGLAMRYHIFYIGTDRMGTFISDRFAGDDITGVDLYFGLKLTSIDLKRKNKVRSHVGCAAYY
jgi:hypothetical protein